MYIITQYGVAVAFCVITMICWGSWANTQKRGDQEGLAVSIVLLGLRHRCPALVFDPCVHPRQQRRGGNVVFSPTGRRQTAIGFGPPSGEASFSTRLIFCSWRRSISQGWRSRFRWESSLALVLGVVTTYIAPNRRATRIFSRSRWELRGRRGSRAGCLRVQRNSPWPMAAKTPVKGIAISVIAGVMMGFFYSFVAKSMGELQSSGGGWVLEAGKIEPLHGDRLFLAGALRLEFHHEHFCHEEALLGRSRPAGRLFFPGQPEAAPDRYPWAG